MKRVVWLVGIVLALSFILPGNLSALDISSDVLISELQVRSAASSNAASEEFIELYNTTDLPINVSTWTLEYKSATGTAWTTKATLHGSLAAHAHYLLVSDKYTSLLTSITDQTTMALDIFSAGLADSAGHIRIVSPGVDISALPVVHDQLGWGLTANAAEGNAPATTPAGGKSLKRTLDSDGKFIDTNNNLADFAVSATPTPETSSLYVAPPEPIPTPPDPTPAPTPPPEQTPVPPVSDQAPADSTPPAITPTPAPDPVPTTDLNPPVTTPLLPPQITELLPNPASPATDSTDEYIELYNPNDQAFDLANFKLQSGNSFSYSYIFANARLEPHQYKAFYITQTGNILANTSGQARLLNPGGEVVAQTNRYETANEGDAWAFLDGAWQWTTTPTPNEANKITLPVLKLTTTKPVVAKITTPKPSTAKLSTPKISPSKKSTAKVASAKTTKTPKPKATAVSRQVYQDPAQTTDNIHPGILAGVGGMTVLYAAYEYRIDVFNRLQQFRRYREIRRATRTTSQGR